MLHISDQNRKQLAYMLSCTTLELQGTPWLDETWGSQDIVSPTHRTDELYISTHYSGKCNALSSLEALVIGNRISAICNERIFRPRVLLIEVLTGKPRLGLNGSDPWTVEARYIFGMKIYP